VLSCTAPEQDKALPPAATKLLQLSLRAGFSPESLIAAPHASLQSATRLPEPYACCTPPTGTTAAAATSDGKLSAMENAAPDAVGRAAGQTVQDWDLEGGPPRQQQEGGPAPRQGGKQRAVARPPQPQQGGGEQDAQVPYSPYQGAQAFVRETAGEDAGSVHIACALGTGHGRVEQVRSCASLHWAYCRVWHGCQREDAAASTVTAPQVAARAAAQVVAVQDAASGLLACTAVIQHNVHSCGLCGKHCAQRVTCRGDNLS
jgi:hypothetical protein